ncbi:serine/threonine-protein kinase Sgk1-like [Oncorhynchus keta]|uniref:serine/threonine-protein kinase Sgk1-like n=1 Tax=Oncorhynchus keta TaxID=8018 RepID=UPI00227CE1B4|nr:serine/threonine-protein kinase Sgk1-like [Oncorhynchus keta]
MKGIVSFFTGKKGGFSNFLHKLVPDYQIIQQVKPSDIHYLKVIGKGSFGTVVSVRHRQSGSMYAVKVLQEQVILRKKEFNPRYPPIRDLKPENTLLDSGGHVVLTDFGLCKEGMSVGGTMQMFCGTPEYLAPEALLGHTCCGAVDWWGLGSVLYERLHGLPPFYSRSKAEMFENILHAPLQLHRSVSQSARTLLQNLLKRDCTKRLGGEHDLVSTPHYPTWHRVLSHTCKSTYTHPYTH